MPRGWRPSRMISPAGAERQPTAEELRRRQIGRRPAPATKPVAGGAISKAQGAMTALKAGISRLRGR